MKIFSNFFKGRDAPINRTSGSAYSQIIRNARGDECKME